MPEDRSAGVVDGDPLFTQPSLQHGEPFGSEIDGMETRAVQERVERRMRRLCHGARAQQGYAVVTAELQRPGVAKHVEEKIALAVENPFRTAGRPRGVEDARRCFGPDLRSNWRRGASPRHLLDVDAPHTKPSPRSVAQP